MQVLLPSATLDARQKIRYINFWLIQPMVIGILSLHLLIPGSSSLKEKRSRLKPLLSRIHKEFNVSAAEMGMNDSWHESLICCAMISNDNGYTHRVLQQIVDFIPANWPDIQIADFRIENV